MDSLLLTEMGKNYGDCVAALTEDDTLYLFGADMYQYFTDVKYFTAKVLPDENSSFDHLERLDRNTAIVRKDGSLLIYGDDNTYGQLGNGTRDPQYEYVALIDHSSETKRLLSALPSETNQQSAAFSNLAPNTLYNFYVMGEKGGENSLKNENLYYIQQIESDENGCIDITYIPTDNWSNSATEFVVRLDDGNKKMVYRDVNATDWFYNAVRFNFEKSLMTGMDEVTFGPYGQLSRAQFALMLYRMEGKPKVDTNKHFWDISGDEWYGDAVLWAADVGIVTGYINGCFGPGDMITREQMTLMMYRYADYLDQNIGSETDCSGFVDSAQVSSFAQKAMGWASSEGIITGKDCDTRIMD